MKYDTHRRNGSDSILHRFLGRACYAIDIDFIELDYSSNPLAVLELKYNFDQEYLENKKHSFQFKAITNIANRLQVPGFIVSYNQDYSSFLVVSLNKSADSYLIPSSLVTINNTECLIEVMNRESFFQFICEIHKYNYKKQELDDFLNLDLEVNFK